MKNTALVILAAALLAGTTRAAVTVGGTGTLQDAGDSIAGTMQVDGVPVDYTLTLTAADIQREIEWNGVGRSEPNGLSWDDHKPGGAHWTLELALSRPANLVFSQVGRPGLANEPTSVWTITWDTAGATFLSDPDSQLDDPLTSTGPGTATFSSTTRVFNSSATWAVFGPDATLFTIQWENVEGSGPGTDAIGINDDLSTIPEPGLLLMMGVGGVLTVLRRRPA